MNYATIVTPTQRNALLVALGGLLVLALYINVSKIFLGSRYFMLLGDALVLCLFAAGVLVYLRRALTATSIEILVALFVCVGVLQLFNPNVPSIQIGLEGFRRLMFQMLGLLIGIAAVRKRSDVVYLWKVILICSLPMLLYAIKQFFVIGDFDQAIIDSNTADIDTWMIFGKIRAFGLFNGPFHLGLFAGIIFWLAVALRIETKQKRYTATAILAFAACIASLTRANVIALIASAPIASFLVFRDARKEIITRSVATLAAAAVLFGIAYWTIPEVSLALEGYSAVESLQNDGRLQGRFEDYHHAIRMLSEYPLGAGMASAGDATGPAFEAKQRVHITSHNMLLWVTIETGMVGLLLFLGILGCVGSSIRTLIRRGEKPMALGACGSFLIVLIAGITGSTLSAYPINLIFWTLAGCYLGYLRQPASRLELLS